jgi:hypothetical protein
MSPIFGLAAPESIFVVLAGELDAVDSDRASNTNFFSGRFSPFSRLRTLSGRREEQVG